MECRECAVKLLAVRDRTESELRDRLEKKGYGMDEIEDTVAAMIEYNYINDRSYAERFISDGLKLRGHGFGRIKTELIRRGISRELAEEMIANAETESNIAPREVIKEIMDRRYASADLSNPKERNRIFGYFARRGYSPRDIWGAINEKSAFKDVEWED